MKSKCKIFLVLICCILMICCSSLPKDENQIWQYNSDKTLGVLVQKDGLHIKKNILAHHDNAILHVDKVIDDKIDTSTVDLYFDSNVDKVYPFTKKGQTYEVFLEYKNTKTGRVVKTSPISIVASGGKGEVSVSSSKDASYNWENWLLTLNSFSKKNAVKLENEVISGTVNVKNKEPYWYNDFKISNNTISLKQLMGKIRGKTFSLELSFEFEYEGEKYYQEFFNNKEKPFTDKNKIGQIGETGLKVLKLSTKTRKPVASREVWEKGFLELDGKTYELQVKGRGNSSWGTSPKHNYSIKLSKKEKLYGMDKSKAWVLISNYTDKTLIRNSYVEYLGSHVFNKMKWNPHFEQVELYINDEYLGTYLFGQRIKIEGSRVNLDEKGFIVEINRREDEDFNFRTKHDVSISLKEPDVVSASEQKRIKNIIQKAEDVLFSENFSDAKSGYTSYFDLDSLIDWYIINEYSKNVDSAWFSSIYLYYDELDGKIHFGPLWDYDLSFGNINYNDCDKTQGFYIQTRGVWFERLFEDPAFCKKVKQRWNEKRSVLYKSIEVEIDRLYNVIKESANYNFERWPILGVYVWPNADGFEKRLSVESEIKYLKNWCYERYEWLDKQFNLY